MGTKTWAAIAAGPPPKSTTPSPQRRMQDLRDLYASNPDTAVLQHALGLGNSALPGSSSHLASLLEHLIIVGIDTEAWTRNTDEMTEIGLAILERKDLRKVHAFAPRADDDGLDQYKHLGDFGEELLKKIQFHHLRIVENAHLRTSATWMRGPEGNRFGRSRFVTFAEARTVLDQVLNQPIESNIPELAGCKRPVLLVGHAVYHDQDNFKRNELNYNMSKHGTIIKEIDTQPLAKETHTWINHRQPSNDVGLSKLTQALGFEHHDPHTACNDAARTLISAIEMVLPEECRTQCRKSMQTIATELEERSQANFVSSWGTELLCTRCGGREHKNTDEEPCTALVHCTACARYDVRYASNPDFLHASTHTEMYCFHVAEYNSWLRRKNNAIRKGQKIPEGPPEGSHPGTMKRRVVEEAQVRPPKKKLPLAENYNARNAVQPESRAAYQSHWLPKNDDENRMRSNTRNNMRRNLDGNEKDEYWGWQD